MEQDFFIIYMCSFFGVLYLCYILIRSQSKNIKNILKPKIKHHEKEDILDSIPMKSTNHYRQLASTRPDHPATWLEWGKFLVETARAKKRFNVKVHHYNEACSCFNQAIEVDPQFTKAWVEWGKTLYELSALDNCANVFTLEGAHTKFQTATNIAPADKFIWVTWQQELANISQIAPKDQQRHIVELYTLAEEKLKEISAKPNRKNKNDNYSFDENHDDDSDEENEGTESLLPKNLIDEIE